MVEYNDFVVRDVDVGDWFVTDVVGDVVDEDGSVEAVDEVPLMRSKFSLRKV